MGEIADQIVNGEVCEMCLMPFPAEGGLGYPAKCIECGGTELHGPPPGTRCGKCKSEDIITVWKTYKGERFLQWHCNGCEEQL